MIELPAGQIAGLVNDLWQRPVTDMGLPGPDKGKGGKFLVLGPGQTAPKGADGFIVVHSSTVNNLVLLRLLATDPKERQATLEKVHYYPLSQRANPPATKVIYPDKGGRTLANAPRGFAYWEKLSRWINEEPVQERDRIMMAMLRSLGIEKGQPFQPDARAAWFYEASVTSAGMVTKTPGVGSIYLGAYKDKGGDWLDGANTYRLHVPPNAPVKQFWSLTVYDVDTRMLIQNKEQKADRSSREPDLVKNADGSVDLYVGPKAPAGFEKNWIPTVPGKAWFPYFRLYAPTEEHFNRKWILPDFEKVK